MRRSLTLLGPLLALPLLLVPLLVSTVAHAHEDDYNDSYDSSDSSDSHYKQKPELGIALEASRSGQSLGFGPGMTGGYLGLHGRLGRRVALGFGIEQAYGDDPSGFKRYDIAWNLPKFYMYLTPKSKAQLYVTTGMDMRVSHFDNGPAREIPAGTPWGFMYIGTFLGGGVDYRIDKTMAFRFEMRAFIRGRTSGKPPNSETPLDPQFNDDTRGARGAIASIGLVLF